MIKQMAQFGFEHAELGRPGLVSGADKKSTLVPVSCARRHTSWPTRLASLSTISRGALFIRLSSLRLCCSGSAVTAVHVSPPVCLLFGLPMGTTSR